VEKLGKRNRRGVSCLKTGKRIQGGGIYIARLAIGKKGLFLIGREMRTLASHRYREESKRGAKKKITLGGEPKKKRATVR